MTERSIGGELRALRLLRGFSQKELAAEAGISAPQVSQIETGRYTPSLGTLARILEVLDAQLSIELNEGESGGSVLPVSVTPPSI